ncbi:MAG: UDP-N-acetylglucosamine--N-acetylmuramyl-(pentapeptide) pyrophosphoryl-undecaprenol N-acetylglucosamine transferase [Candidatus Omnitrophica bacterium]|nr:UDP-N-acetylglucosamine--N-acetylmuramyl-(pentapeptide) pyrophosphoryl-undecaprenol N-acetylglucosamine transferase [Candidatus Omnitrophota bacterium]
MSEGSGGHLIPAMEVAKTLAGAGHRARLWYVQRPTLSALLRESLDELRAMGVEIETIQVVSSRWPFLRVGIRLGQVAALWIQAHRRLRRFHPHAVVGFGGWVGIPIILAARQRRVRVLLHEQNVRLGRANRFVLRRHWVDRLAISFESTRASLNGTPTTLTGLPLREAPERRPREETAQRFGLSTSAWTILVMGGSQGSRVLNRLMDDVVAECSEEECANWQFIHVTGPHDVERMRQRYAARGIRAWAAPHLIQMHEAYQLAHVMIARAGASTLAELARYGCPSILVPYPHASGHQRDNAELVESIGGGLIMEEAQASAPRLLGVLRRMAADVRLRDMMATQIRSLARPEATRELASLIERITDGTD